MQGRQSGVKCGGAERDFETFTEHRSIKNCLSCHFETFLRLLDSEIMRLLDKENAKHLDYQAVYETPKHRDFETKKTPPRLAPLNMCIMHTRSQESSEISKMSQPAIA